MNNFHTLVLVMVFLTWTQLKPTFSSTYDEPIGFCHDADNDGLVSKAANRWGYCEYSSSSTSPAKKTYWAVEDQCDILSRPSTTATVSPPTLDVSENTNHNVETTDPDTYWEDLKNTIICKDFDGSNGAKQDDDDDDDGSQSCDQFDEATWDNIMAYVKSNYLNLVHLSRTTNQCLQSIIMDMFC